MGPKRKRHKEKYEKFTPVKESKEENVQHRQTERFSPLSEFEEKNIHGRFSSLGKSEEERIPPKKK